jgi:hypothetical protein
MVATETTVHPAGGRETATPLVTGNRRARVSNVIRPVIIFLVSRAVVVAATKGAALLPPKASVMHLLGGWDGGWYLTVAERGYPSHVPIATGNPGQSDIAFFPLFPLLTRGLHAIVPVSMPWSALILSTLFGLTATVALWQLTCRLTSSDVADRVVLLFCFFPGSIVFTMFYAEGLMLTLSILCLEALMRRRWLLAGIFAGLATATRPNAIVLAICCAWAAAMAIRQRREWRSLVAVVLAPLGVLAYFGYLWHRTGSALVWFRVESRGWGEKVDFGVKTVDRLHMAWSHPWANPNNVATSLGLIFVLAAIPFVVRARLPAVLVIFTAGIILLGVWSKTLGLRPRFVLTAFPLFMALGMRLRPTAQQLVVAGSAGMLALMMVLVAHGVIVP